MKTILAMFLVISAGSACVHSDLDSEQVSFGASERKSSDASQAGQGDMQLEEKSKGGFERKQSRCDERSLKESQLKARPEISIGVEATIPDKEGSGTTHGYTEFDECAKH
ncbi:MAG: hypothetical protein NT027_07200 [Proteobacteria bacterium]|nr:hypothetical protein [Pseudomonadota bacterium]